MTADTRKTPANLLELMENSIDLILEEPRRIKMVFWLRQMSNVPPEERAFHEELYGTVPPCNTQGCLAGWMAVQLGHKSTEMFDLDKLLSQLGTTFECLYTTPGWQHDLYKLFLGKGCYVFPSVTLMREQPRLYAEGVVANIRRYIANWEQDIRNVPILPESTT